jgi:hypothetical protein
MPRNTASQIPNIDHGDVISLVDLAVRFDKAKGMEDMGFEWLRRAPGRGSSEDELVGNSLAVLKAIRAFNASNSNPIEVFNASGYDGTAKQVMIISKSDIIRLKGFILRGGGVRKTARRRKEIPFKITGKVPL